MKRIIQFFVCLSLLGLLNPVSGQIIHVPMDQPTIQDGIDVAINGDTVLVHPGVYSEQIVFNGTNIIVGSLYIITDSLSYIDSTIIEYNGSSSSYVVNLGSGLNETFCIAGFTIDAGSQTNAIHVYASSPVILQNKILARNNWGIRCDNSATPTIKNNRIESTNANIGFCAIRSVNSAPIIIGNTLQGPQWGSSVFGIECLESPGISIINNYIFDFYMGIKPSGDQTKIIGNLIDNCQFGLHTYDSDMLLINNTVVNCQNMGIDAGYGVSEIVNCIIYDNQTNLCQWSDVSVKNSCIPGGLPANATDLGGNIYIDPIFNNPEVGDYSLKEYSPCVEAGVNDTTGLYLPTIDYFGSTRIQDGNGDSIAIIDMGFYESYQISNPGYIQGHVTLDGGTGSAEDVLVGVGATVSPDSLGNYTIAISPDGGPYTVTAQLDGYLTQSFQNIDVSAGQTTSGVDFLLEPYIPANCLNIAPEIIYFLDEMTAWYGVEVEIINDCLMDITLADVYCGNYSWSFRLEPDNFTPMILNAGESYSFTVFPDIILDSVSEEIITDSLFIFTNVDNYAIEILLDKDLVYYSMDENSKDAFELNVFPNPTKGKTYLEFISPIAQNVTFEIMNSMGIMVETRSFQNTRTVQFEWDTSMNKKKIKSGLYYCRLLINGSTVDVEKIVIVD